MHIFYVLPAGGDYISGLSICFRYNEDTYVYLGQKSAKNR
jgi:hypothetical protein